MTADGPEHYSLDAPPSARYPKGLFFGAVKVGARYVGYHLMPIYGYPELLDGLSERLRRRMQGKSCFNFTALDDALATELAELTAAGFARFEQEKLIV